MALVLPDSPSGKFLDQFFHLAHRAKMLCLLKLLLVLGDSVKMDFLVLFLRNVETAPASPVREA